MAQPAPNTLQAALGHTFREQAVNEYRAALTVRDGQADTRLAAEKGLKQPYAVPKQEHTEPQGDDDPAPEAPSH